MNKRQIVASLNKIANELDNSGLFREANTVTKVMEKLAAFESIKPLKSTLSVDFSDLIERFKKEDEERARLELEEANAPLHEKIRKLFKDKDLTGRESGYSADYMFRKVFEYFVISDKEAFKEELLKYKHISTDIGPRIYKVIIELENFQKENNLSDQEMIEGITNYFKLYARLPGQYYDS